MSTLLEQAWHEAEAMSAPSAEDWRDYQEFAEEVRREEAAAEPHGREWLGAPDLCLYRDRTLAILRRYMRVSTQVGRLPSLLGRELFRTRVTRYRTTTLEELVIFVHDVETSLAKLKGSEQQMLSRVVLQEYSFDQAAQILGIPRRSFCRFYLDAVDRLSEIFLEVGIVNPHDAGRRG
jgi:hypothetical protein